MFRLQRHTKVVSLLVALMVFESASAERIKDLASIEGVRANHLLGYGLVVGLDGTGDKVSQTGFTAQSLKSFLNNFNLRLPADFDPQVKNVAAVVVHANLPPFSRTGQSIDVTVSSLGNAKSLRGGSLLMTPLRGADGEVYAVAQGNLIVNGFGAQADGSSITVNVPSVGRIPNGALIERVVATEFAASPSIVLQLNEQDFTTAKRMTDTINAYAGVDTASAIDSAAIRVKLPENTNSRVRFISQLENLTIEPGEAAAKVIVNSRTGTVVIGQHVKVLPAAVTHGSLSVMIRQDPVVSQPNEFAQGDTVVVPTSEIEIDQEENRMFLFEPGVSLDAIVKAVNEVGAAPGDLVAILEALKQVGALRAELEVI